MKKIFGKIICAVSVLCTSVMLSSCVTVRKVGNLNKVYVTNTKQINILPPSELVEDIDALVYLSLSFNGSSFGLPTYLQADKECIYISIMNDFGTEMGSLYYDGVSVDMDCAMMPPELKGEYIINDLQYALYNVDSVKRNLALSKLELRVEQNDVVELRKVYSGSNLIETVSIQDHCIVITNHLRGYEYSLSFE